MQYSMSNGCCVGEITDRFLAWSVHSYPHNVWLSVFVLGLAHCEILFVSIESVDMPDA